MGVLLYPYSVVALRLKTSQFFALFVKERCFDNPLHLIHIDFFYLPNPIPLKSFFKGTVSLEVLLYIVYVLVAEFLLLVVVEFLLCC